MSWFPKPKSDDEIRADRDREARRSQSESKARQLAWAEREAKKNPDSKLAQGILDHNRNNF
ncbi:hypothetical protein ABZY32_16510 [Nocardiopsis alba]|uniref:hypothetical protein n=1 Tax=Nocardiopsis alba TaxID=53437 RepID=UPI0033AAC8BD